MQPRLRVFCALATVVMVGGISHAQNPPPAAAKAAPPSKAQLALDQAGKDGQYTFIVFYRNDDAATQAMVQVVNTQIAKEELPAVSLFIQVTDPAERALVEKFAVSRAPMPLTMALAPNRAITGVFPQKVTPKSLADAFVTPAMTRCMKSLQEGKVVLVCVQSSDKVFAPPGMLIGKFSDRATRDEMAAALAQAGKCCDDPNCKHNHAAQSAPSAAARPMPSANRRN